jgi:hypothetical protein
MDAAERSVIGYPQGTRRTVAQITEHPSFSRIPAFEADLVLPEKVSRSRHGLAIPAALFAMVIIAALTTAIFLLADIQGRAVQNRESSARAFMLAEEGLTHALTVLRDTLRNRPYSLLLRGSDGVVATADDGLLIGYGMSESLQIPGAGRVTANGTYSVTMVDDPADPDANAMEDQNGRVLVRCTAVTTNGAQATVHAVIGGLPLPGVASDGDMSVGGSARITGPCGGLHANDDLILGPNPIINGTVSASDQVSGTARDTTGAVNHPLAGQPKMEIPDLNPEDYCGRADFVLRADGMLVKKGNPDQVFNATSNAQFGWKRSSTSPLVWDLSGNSAVNGTVCAEGNVKISGNPGSDVLPLRMSVIATGSIEISGNPFMQPSSPDSILFMAGGDLSISGNPGAVNDNFDGLIYSESQCKISGNPTMEGQLLCKDKPNPAGTVEHASMNEITGSLQLRYSCNGKVNGRRRIMEWMQRSDP